MGNQFRPEMVVHEKSLRIENRDTCACDSCMRTRVFLKKTFLVPSPLVKVFNPSEEVTSPS